MSDLKSLINLEQWKLLYLQRANTKNSRSFKLSLTFVQPPITNCYESKMLLDARTYYPIMQNPLSMSYASLNIVFQAFELGNRQINEKHIAEKSRHDRKWKRGDKFLRNYKNKK